MSEETLFHEALAKPLAERAAFLDSACGDDVALRTAVEALLAAHDASRDLFNHPPAGLVSPSAPTETFTASWSGDTSDTADDHPDARVGTIIAERYALIQKIGEGGMGEVWVAKQTEPIKRNVAVKLIKLGMDSRSVLARFEQERQALAMMDHPNIAGVLDGGMTGEGQPFFVMELINGQPLMQFCDAKKLNVRERLELFVAVCKAVQHAHQKGIIHRDLKPSNILVSVYDGKPIPKVIDFGVVKATGSKLTDNSFSTLFGNVVGTLEYMSPEQAGGSVLDIDTRSDIYSLGVVLYELLTGLRPIDAAKLHQRALSEVLRIIQEEEPRKPSTRLSLDGSLATAAALRQTEPRKLTALLRGELDWVVMRCLEKQRDRRYETANALARDVERYLCDEPVEARPPSTGYRLRKFVRRNRGQVIAASLVFLTLVTGVVGTTLGLIEAKRQEGLAKQREDAERQAKEEAVRDQKITQAVQEFLQEKLLRQADVNAQADALLGAGRPAAEATMNPTIRELLDRAAKELSEETIEKNFPGEPLLQAELLYTVGVTYHGIGVYEQAIDFLKRARKIRVSVLGSEHEQTIKITHALGTVYIGAGELSEAVRLCELAYEARKATLGPDHLDTLDSLDSLAIAYHIAVGPARALPFFEQVYDRRKAILGEDDPETLTSLHNLASAYAQTGNQEQAEKQFLTSLELRIATLGEQHPDTFTSMNSLGWFYWQFGETQKALKQFKKTLVLVEGHFGSTHPNTLSCKNNLASAYLQMGRPKEALQEYQKVYAEREAILGPEHHATLTSMNNLATAYWHLNQLDESIPLFEKALKALESQFTRDHPDTALTIANLGVNYKDAGRLEDALPLLEEAYQALKKYPHLRETPRHLLQAYLRAEKTSEAVGLTRELLAAGLVPVDDIQLSGELAIHGLSRLKAEAFADAEPLIRASLAIREKQLPDLWLTFNSMTMLGGSLLGQMKYDEAEPLLLKGYEGMKLREESIPKGARTRIPEALDRLVELYTALEQADEVKRWQAERAKYPPPSV